MAICIVREGGNTQPQSFPPSPASISHLLARIEINCYYYPSFCEQTNENSASSRHSREAIVSRFKRSASFLDSALPICVGRSPKFPKLTHHALAPPRWLAWLCNSQQQLKLLPIHRELRPRLRIRQMPFGIHKHSNRSKQALNDPAVQGTVTEDSASPSPSFASGTNEASQQAFTQQASQARAESQPYAAQSIVPDIDRRTYQTSGDLPARSQSTRFPSAYQHQASLPQAGNSADDLALDSRKLQPQGTTNSAQGPVIEPKKSKSLFDRMRSGSTRTSEQKLSAPTQSSYNNTAGLARRLSKRQENPPVIRTAQQRNSLEQQQRLDWQAGQDSRSHLPSPQEGAEDDSGLDPYLIRESEQEDHHIPAQDQGQQQTIRPVQSDSEAPIYSTEEDERLHFQAQQQYSLNQAHQQAELAQPSHYQSSNLNQPHLQVNNPSGTLAAHDPYRSQQNPETVSQLSYESPIEQQREEQRPISVQSNGQSPTGYSPQRQEYPNRTTSIQGPRPLSQHLVMAPPPPGTSQQNRRTTDPKQTMQGTQGQQGQQDGPPPTYRQSSSFNQSSAPGLAAQGAGSGPNYRGGPPQRDQYGAVGGGEQGRSTPPPAPGDRDVNDAYKELCKLDCTSCN